MPIMIPLSVIHWFEPQSQTWKQRGGRKGIRSGSKGKRGKQRRRRQGRDFRQTENSCSFIGKSFWLQFDPHVFHGDTDRGIKETLGGNQRGRGREREKEGERKGEKEGEMDGERDKEKSTAIERRREKERKKTTMIYSSLKRNRQQDRGRKKKFKSREGKRVATFTTSIRRAERQINRKKIMMTKNFQRGK